MLKYEVVIDKELLSKLKYEIIEKCSIIIHKDYQDTYLPKMYGIDDYLKYRNYSEVKIGVREYNDFYSICHLQIKNNHKVKGRDLELF